MKKIIYKRVVIIGLIGVLFAITACGKSEENNKESTNNISEIQSTESKKVSQGPIKWEDNKGYDKVENPYAFYQLNYPDDWTKDYGGTSPGHFFPKSDATGLGVYNLITGAHIDNNTSPFKGTIEDIPVFMEAQVRKYIRNYCLNEKEFKQTYDSVTRVDDKFLKVKGTITGISLGGVETKLNYFGYYSLFTNEGRGVSNVPIYWLITVKSDDKEKLQYAETIVDEMAKTLEPIK